MLSLVVVVFLYLVVCCKLIYKKKCLNWKKITSLVFDPKQTTAFGRCCKEFLVVETYDDFKITKKKNQQVFTVVASSYTCPVFINKV